MVCSLLTTKSVSLIFKEPVKFLTHRIKHEFFMHKHEIARGEGQSMPRYPQKLIRPYSSRLQNRPLRSARQSDFGLGRRSRVSVRSRNTNPREESVIGNRLLRPARRSDFGPGRQWQSIKCYLGGRETRICARKGSGLAEISVLQGKTTHRNQYIHIF